VLAVVSTRVVVDVLGFEKWTRASSLPSQRWRMGLYTMPFSFFGLGADIAFINIGF